MATSDKKYKLRGDDPYREIAMAAIRQAVMDYKTLSRGITPEWILKRAGNTREKEMRRIELFFASEDFKLYTDMDGPTMLRKVKEQIACKMRKKVV